MFLLASVLGLGVGSFGLDALRMHKQCQLLLCQTEALQRQLTEVRNERDAACATLKAAALHEKRNGSNRRLRRLFGWLFAMANHR